MTWRPAHTVCTCRPALIDRVRAALEREPQASLTRLLWLTGDDRPEMVATLARMIRLSGARATVAPSDQRIKACHTCVSSAANPTASLRASSSGVRA